MEPSIEQQDRKRAEPRGQRLPLRALDSRGRKLCDLMLFGADPDEAEQYGFPPNSPLTLEQAAVIVGLKMTNARFIFSQKFFLAAYSEGLKQLRRSHQARALGTLAQIMDDDSDQSAAKTVRVKCANALLDNPEARGPNVNIQVNNGVTLQAGVVIRLPSGVQAPPLESGDPAPAIEHQPAHRTTAAPTRLAQELADAASADFKALERRRAEVDARLGKLSAAEKEQFQSELKRLLKRAEITGAKHSFRRSWSNGK